MTRFTIDIPEEKVEFFSELIKNLGFDNEVEIPDSQKELVVDRISKSEKDPSLLLAWDDIKEDFSF